jgi:hypothetical protein
MLVATSMPKPVRSASSNTFNVRKAEPKTLVAVGDAGAIVSTE